MTRRPRTGAGDAGAPRLASLTGLRFVAALAVFGFHAQSLLPSWPVLAPLLAGGQSGVSFFFVLSGFVLTWSAADEPVAARAFWRRRAARILPGYWVAWLAGIPVTWLFFGTWPSVVSLVGTGTLTQSWFDDKSVYFGVNGVGWSLSCEVLFYALFPTLLPVIRRLSGPHRWAVALGCVAALVGLDTAGLLAAGAAAGDPAGSTFWWVSILPISRLPEFVLGMVAGRALSSGVLRAMPMPWAVALAVSAVYAAGLFPAAAVAGALTVVPFVLLICSTAQRDLSGRPGMIGAAWCVRLGTWSYAFYLTHQLVLRLWQWLWPATELLWLHLLLGLLSAVLVSAGVHRFVEKPAERRWRARRSAPPVMPARSGEQHPTRRETPGERRSVPRWSRP